MLGRRLQRPFVKIMARRTGVLRAGGAVPVVKGSTGSLNWLKHRWQMRADDARYSSIIEVLSAALGEFSLKELRHLRA